VTKAATRTYSAMDLETSMVAAAVTTKEGASVTDMVMVIMKATNGIPCSAYGCSIERETRATDTEAIQRTGPRLASGYSMVTATRATDVVTTQGTDCSLGLRGIRKEKKGKDRKEKGMEKWQRPWSTGTKLLLQSSAWLHALLRVCLGWWGPSLGPLALRLRTPVIDTTGGLQSVTSST